MANSDVADVDRSIELYRRVTTTMPDPGGTPAWLTTHLSFAKTLADRAVLRASLADLDESISIAEDTLAHCAPDSPYLPFVETNVAVARRERHTRAGLAEDVHRGVELYRHATQRALD